MKEHLQFIRWILITVNMMGDKKMRCPFCKKEIENATSFCPECGQKLGQYIQSPEIENYWSEVNKADSQRNEQYKGWLRGQPKQDVEKSISLLRYL